jgi:hypothetical protein
MSPPARHYQRSYLSPSLYEPNPLSLALTQPINSVVRGTPEICFDGAREQLAVREGPRTSRRK